MVKSQAMDRTSWKPVAVQRACMRPMLAGQVLVVDDDLDIRVTLREALEDEGHEVVEASDGVAALRAMRASTRPMVVLLDLMMPRLDGEGVLHEVVGDRQLAQHVYFLVTAKGNAISEGLRTLLQSLSVPVLPKPVDLDELLDLVARAAARLPSTSSTERSGDEPSPARG
jgi:CheY-like chemotaxis protein